MIDVTFQLLIFFLVATTVRQEEGQIPGSLPRVGGIVAAKKIELRPIRIVLHPIGKDLAGCIYELPGLSSIETPNELFEALKTRQEKMLSVEIPVIIDPRSDVRWGHVVEAFNQTVRAKYTRVGFAYSH
jgi:biopolymer transport protein ExbD